MFDVGFSELLLLLVLGVVVVGPKRLPELVRLVVRFKHHVMRTYWNFQDRVNEELKLDDLRNELEQKDMERHIQQLNQSIMDATQQTENAWERMKSELDKPPAALQQQVQPDDLADTGEEPRRDLEALPTAENVSLSKKETP